MAQVRCSCGRIHGGTMGPKCAWCDEEKYGKKPEPTLNEVRVAVIGQPPLLAAFCMFMNVMPEDVTLSGPVFFKCRQSKFEYTPAGNTFIRL